MQSGRLSFLSLLSHLAFASARFMALRRLVEHYREHGHEYEHEYEHEHEHEQFNVTSMAHHEVCFVSLLSIVCCR